MVAVKLSTEEVERATLLAGHFLRAWCNIGTEVWCNHERIGKMDTPEMAEYVAKAHNVFLPLANRVVQLHKKVQNLSRLLEVQR